MAKCVIFCAGDFDFLAAPIEKGDILIAADGGLRHTAALNLTPDVVLGDFDSLGFTPEGASVYPAEKDDTDAMLALRRGLELGCREFYLYGCLDGKRLDHTVANFQALQFLCDHNAGGFLIGKDYIVTVLQNESLCFPREAEGIISLFCLGPDVRGVTLTGLQYPLTDAVLTAGFPLGVSNHFTGQEAIITVQNGSLLAMWDRKNAFPQRR